jgi:hypothetical protein
MYKPAQHEMLLESISPIGTEEWVCPTCERRLLKLSWHPDFKEIVVRAGNESATHNTGEGLPQGPKSPGKQTRLTAEEERRLAPWLEWMEATDFDNLWFKDH